MDVHRKTSGWKKSAASTAGIVIAAVIWLGAYSPAAACPIPVFQYSIEYWDSDPYDVVIHYDGSLTAGQQEAVDRLENAERGEGHHANITVMLVDHSERDNPNPSGNELPRIELRYPMISGIRGTLWEGPLDMDVIGAMLHSPVRQEIAEKLLDRNAGVWVLLESGNRSRDREVRRTLERELARLENTLKVPDPAEEYGIDMGDIHTEIDFSVVSLSRDDPAEQIFINMLLGTERDLREFDEEPIVFPVYGRGLVMYALIGDGINTWTLTEAGEFLTGPCSCIVKAGNPGVDLLMSIDWNGIVERRSVYGIPGADTGGFIDRMDEAEERLNQ